MSTREGITGTGALHYPDDPDLLRGVLASEVEEKVYTRGDAPRRPQRERCEHGKLLGPNFNCKVCAWLFGWVPKEAK